MINDNTLGDTHGLSSILGENESDANVDGQVLPLSVNNDSSLGGEFADVFDRYATALDAGDHQAAEAILSEYPEIGEEYRAPLRGLYLLGRTASHQEFESQQADVAERRHIGDFEIEYELGRGGMGIVYAATQNSLHRRVALKVLPFTAVLDPRQVARFRNEAQAAASLHHPNIVPVYAVGCERGVHYYSMQLIEGQSLEQFIEQFKEHTKGGDTNARSSHETAKNRSTIASVQTLKYVKSIIEMGADVATAIDFAHEQGIVHRDIKPSNLMLDQTGKVWVTDFGLARCRGASNLTSQGERLGTARYMSPEQASGRNNQVDFRTDIYSLGVTLYELLALRPAFGETDRVQLLASIESTTPAPLRSINSAIPMDLETVIEKAMARTPAERYQSSKEFADDLKRCLRGEPIKAKRKTVLDRIGKAMEVHKKVVACTGLGLLFLVIAASMIASVFYQQKQREHLAAENAKFYLGQAHQAVDRFGSILTDELINVPGTEPLQARLIGEAIGFYDDFLKHAGDVSELKFERAQAFSTLAHLHSRAGRDSDALSFYDRAIKEFIELEVDPSLKENALYEQAVCLDRLGLIQKRMGRYEKSQISLQNAMVRFESINRTPRRPAVVAAASQTVANLAMLCWSQGELKKAETYFEQALSHIESSSATHLENEELRSAYFKINGNFVSVLATSDLSKAERVLRRSISALESLQSSEAIGKELLHENLAYIADMQNNLAVVFCKSDQLDQAERFAQRAISYWQEQNERRPQDLTVSERLATAQNTLGEVFWRKNAAGLGDESFAIAEELLRRVVDRLPHRPDPLSRLAGVLHNRSLVAHRYEKDDDASRLIELAIAYQKRAAKLIPENSRYTRLLSSHQQALAVYTARD